MDYSDFSPAAPGRAHAPAAQHLTPRIGVQYNRRQALLYFARKGLGSDMDKPAQNIQDSFLNNARKDKVVLTIYLMSGVKLSGRIKSFDKYSLVLETNNQEQLIFKHAISTVVTQKSSHSYAPAPQAAAQTAAGGPAPGPTAPHVERTEG
jgi:host factor-I protein